MAIELKKDNVEKIEPFDYGNINKRDKQVVERWRAGYRRRGWKHGTKVEAPGVLSIQLEALRDDVKQAKEEQRAMALKLLPIEGLDTNVKALQDKLEEQIGELKQEHEEWKKERTPSDTSPPEEVKGFTHKKYANTRQHWCAWSWLSGEPCVARPLCH